MTVREASDTLIAERNRVVGRYGEVPVGYTALLPSHIYLEAMHLPYCGFDLEKTDGQTITFRYDEPEYCTL